MTEFDPLRWWAKPLEWLGWTVQQDFHVMKLGYQNTPVLWSNGFFSRARAEASCDLSQGQWVRRVIEVWRD